MVRGNPIGAGNVNVCRKVLANDRIQAGGVGITSVNITGYKDSTQIAARWERDIDVGDDRLKETANKSGRESQALADKSSPVIA